MPARTTRRRRARIAELRVTHVAYRTTRPGRAAGRDAARGLAGRARSPSTTTPPCAAGRGRRAAHRPARRSSGATARSSLAVLHCLRGAARAARTGSCCCPARTTPCGRSPAIEADAPRRRRVHPPPPSRRSRAPRRGRRVRAPLPRCAGGRSSARVAQLAAKRRPARPRPHAARAGPTSGLRARAAAAVFHGSDWFSLSRRAVDAVLAAPTRSARPLPAHDRPHRGLRAHRAGQLGAAARPRPPPLRALRPRLAQPAHPRRSTTSTRCSPRAPTSRASSTIRACSTRSTARLTSVAANDPAASILFPTRDRRDYLAVALASVAPQAARARRGDRDRRGRRRGRGDRGSSPSAHGAQLRRARPPARHQRRPQRGGRRLERRARVLPRRRRRGLARLARRAARRTAAYEALGGPIRPRLEGSRLRACGREPLPVTALDLGAEDRDAEFVWGANMALRRARDRADRAVRRGARRRRRRGGLAAPPARGRRTRRLRRRGGRRPPPHGPRRAAALARPRRSTSAAAPRAATTSSAATRRRWPPSCARSPAACGTSSGGAAASA